MEKKNSASQIDAAMRYYCCFWYNDGIIKTALLLLKDEY
jgi:hypothetical protein